jgi:hypothetical protein
MDALAVVADEDEHLGGGARAHTVGLDHVRCELAGEPLETNVVLFEFGVEELPTPDDGAQAGLGRSQRGGERAWADRGEVTHQGCVAKSGEGRSASCRLALREVDQPPRGGPGEILVDHGCGRG